MLETCKAVGMNYEALKFYCNEGLVPHVKRDQNNRRIFSDKDVAWIKSLACLKACGMSIRDMKAFLQLCLLGEGTIPERQTILARQRLKLLNQIEALRDSIAYIDKKQEFYSNVLQGNTQYISNLVP